MMNEADIKRLRYYAISHVKHSENSFHGIDHWDRVARNGKALYVSGVDIEVVFCFAYLHDVERDYDGYDEEHGPKAAKLIDLIRDSMLGFLNDGQIGLLKDACAFHTTVLRTGEPTIDTCFDADRLDLPRVGIIPDHERMATKNGKEKARQIRARKQKLH